MRKKTTILLTLILAITVFHFTGFDRYLTLKFIQEHKELITNFSDKHAILCTILIGITYLGMALLQLPGITVITLLLGALFGAFASTIITVLLGTLNALIALFLSRYLLHDYFQKKYKKYLKHFNSEFKERGGIYIFLLHVCAFLPYQLVNILAGLTKVKMRPFLMATTLGILPHAVIFSLLGSAVWQISSVKDLFSPQLVTALTICGIIPLIYIFINLKKKSI